MTAPLAQHQTEIERNQRTWDNKPLLKEIYEGFHRRVLSLIDPAIPGRIVESALGAHGQLVQGCRFERVSKTQWYRLTLLSLPTAFLCSRTCQ